FTYTAIDDSGTGNATSTSATVTVTVTGTNDQPSASAVAISADEDGATVDGTFVVAGDADTTDSHTFDITSAPSEGSVVNNNDGTFTFDPGSDFQDLADGETRDVTFTYTAIDDSGTGNATSTSATVTITVTGTNDQPIAGAVAISADEDGATVDGTFVVAGDADTTDSHTFDITSAPGEGSVVNNNDGTFTFNPGSDFQDLADGETRDVTFTYTAIDDSGTGNATSTSATVTVTVTGTNDQPTASAVSISADEDGATVDGTFVVAGDADTTDSHTFDITSAPSEGSVVNNNDGTFTFDPGSDFQDLANGETRDVTFTYTAIDDSGTGNATSTSATVTVTVTGTNDQPSARAVAISVDEDGATVDGIFVLAGDADTTDNHTFDITSAPSEGSVVNNNDGTFTFDPGSDFQDLADGETRDVAFTYTAIDDSGTGNATSTSVTVTVTVTGTNDQPTAGAVAISADEDGATVDGTFVLTGDADTTDTHTFDITSAPAEGSVVNNNDGTFTFDPGSDFQDLADGETRDVTFTYTATDDSGTGNATSTAATVSITVTGTNDQPTAGAVAISADEDGATVDGTFVVAGDADTTDSHTFDITSAPAEGSVVNNNDGTFTFDPGSDFQDLADGETRDVTFTYTVIDNSGTANNVSTSEIVTVTVTGSNDQPQVSALTLSTEVTANSVSGTFNVTDADSSDTHQFLIVSQPAEGILVNNGDGTFTFNLNDEFKDLELGAERSVTFTYIAMDDSGSNNDSANIKTVVITVINNTYVAPTVELPTDTAATNEDTGTGKKPANDTTDDTDSQEEGGPVDQGPTIANETIIVSDLTPTDGGPALAPTIDIDNNTDGLFEAERDGLRELNDKLSVFVPAELAVVESMQKQFMLYNEPLELVKSDNFMRQLDQMREMIDQQTGSRDNLVGSAFGVSAGLTAGYVVWLARSGVLLSSLMSSLPIWRFIDPLPILGGTPVATAQDDETLQSMVASTELSERDAIQEGESQ
ncbi:MAG: tandem-95 repeat protein, partial [Gammaproteobacteria bacterium]|nr:tandem-95 repeat protein [Gammaproteobacteria bacterium]